MSQTSRRWTGTMTAIITPFDERGEVDVHVLTEFVERQIRGGVSAIVPCGTTGEGATLTDQEKQRVVQTAVDCAAGRVPVIAGCGSNDTRKTLESARQAADAGADALLVVTPYYNKPNRSGMMAHYEAVCRVGLPVVVYNVPGRTGQNLPVDWTLELAQLDEVEAVKEASADLEQIASLIAGRPSDLSILSGDDSLVLPTMALGADGVISVVANEAPTEMSALVSAVLAGDYTAARRIHYQLLPLMRTNFVESNPVPVKCALEKLGVAPSRVRAPLGPASTDTELAIESALRLADLVDHVGDSQ